MPNFRRRLGFSRALLSPPASKTMHLPMFATSRSRNSCSGVPWFRQSARNGRLGSPQCHHSPRNGCSGPPWCGQSARNIRSCVPGCRQSALETTGASPGAATALEIFARAVSCATQPRILPSKLPSKLLFKDPCSVPRHSAALCPVVQSPCMDTHRLTLIQV